MVVDYVTVGAVASGLGLTIDSTTNPSTATVEGWITDNSRQLDELHFDGVPWGYTKTATDEYLDCPKRVNTVYTKYPRVTAITTLEGWNGSAWITQDQGRAYNTDDFYLENPRAGKIKLLQKEAIGNDYLRVTYTYGSASVPDYIERACKLMTMIQVLDARMGGTEAGECEDWVNAMIKQKSGWKKELKKIINRRVKKWRLRAENFGRKSNAFN
jgi:hypothetical protein